MAAESFGRTVYLNDEQFEQVVRAMTQANEDSRETCENEIKWGDPIKIAERLKLEYANAK